MPKGKDFNRLVIGGALFILFMLLAYCISGPIGRSGNRVRGIKPMPKPASLYAVEAIVNGRKTYPEVE